MSLQLLRRGLRLPSLAARPVRSYYTNPPQEHVGAREIIIGLCSFYGACLVPSFYILANVENYRKRE